MLFMNGTQCALITLSLLSAGVASDLVVNGQFILLKCHGVCYQWLIVNACDV